MMIAIQRLTLVEPQYAAPGTLMIQRAGYSGPPILATNVVDQGRDVAAVFSLDTDGDSRFKVRAAATNEGSWLAIEKWELRVASESSYSSLQRSPVAGDAFIWDGVPGIVGKIGQSALYVPIAGTAFEEKGWGGFVGFSKWSIVVWTADGDDAKELFAR